MRRQNPLTDGIEDENVVIVTRQKHESAGYKRKRTEENFSEFQHTRFGQVSQVHHSGRPGSQTAAMELLTAVMNENKRSAYTEFMAVYALNKAFQRSDLGKVYGIRYWRLQYFMLSIFSYSSGPDVSRASVSDA